MKDDKFNALVLSVFSGNRSCPVRFWKESCDAVVKWDDTNFTYKPL
jgi:hypothetical protein